MKHQPKLLQSLLTTSAACAAAVLAAPLALADAPADAQHTTPNVITVAGDVTHTLAGSTIINHGMVGMGRISATTIDSFGETFGSVSALQVTNWQKQGTSYTGRLNILPDRGYNTGNFFAGYASRVQTVDFTFTPFTEAGGIGGSDIASEVAAQNQITFTSAINGTKLSYIDPTTSLFSYTTGLDPFASSASIFGRTMPYVTTYTGNQAPSSVATTVYNNINKLPIDAEALALKPDGTGYLGDEYGPNVYYFNSSYQIVGAITPPAAILPHAPAGTLNFGSISAPVNGRRNNQGLEGVALSPDHTKLFALLQSAAVQDCSSNQATRLNTRLLVYNVSTNPTPSAPEAEYVLQLPTYRSNGDGSAVDSTCAQSEIIALDNDRILVLSRDGNGLGNLSTNPNVFKSVLFVDRTVGNPTNIAGTARDDEGGKVTTSAGVLDPAITPLTWVEAVNMLNQTQLNKFNMHVDTGGASQVDKLTLGEKWEGMALVPAQDPSAPNDYFLFIGNDNDFLTSDGHMVGPDGTLVSYNAFAGYPANRIPAAVSPGTQNENDTLVLAYRLTIQTPSKAAPAPTPVHPPTVKVTGKKTVHTGGSVFTLKGQAQPGDNAVAGIEIKVGNGAFHKAKGTAKWSYQLKLKPGRNVVQIRSVDTTGTISTTTKIVVIRG